MWFESKAKKALRELRIEHDETLNSLGELLKVNLDLHCEVSRLELENARLARLLAGAQAFALVREEEAADYAEQVELLQSISDAERSKLS